MRADAVKELLEHLVLERTGPAEATVGMISLPLPRELAADVRIDHPAAAMLPVGWWERNKVARRAIAYVLDDTGVPEGLRLTDGPSPDADPPDAWQFRTEPTLERLSFNPHSFRDVDGLRGVPAEDCLTAQAELRLTFGGRTLALQAGATGPKGGPYYWENVQIDPLWRNPVAQAIRVGGVIYNEDTYLWADLYLLLFRNGVVDVAAHFVNTKLHIKGYDFQGLPVIRLGGDAVQGRSVTLPAGGPRVDLGGTSLNLGDAAILCSDEHPGRIEEADGEALWYPVSRTFNPQVEDAPPTEWYAGFARTVRFQFSLSGAAPVIARYRAPAWWYAVSGEPWPWGYLPVRGQFDRLGEILTDSVRASMTRGRFDAGSGGSANDGDGGQGMMHNYYHTGRPEILHDALDHCYYWADLAVDHSDFTVHQWIGGWPWKTCAYTKFRDVLYGYLETGDPYLRDTCEMAAEAYWAWFRANWPRCSIGRDNFEMGAWALMWRFFDSQHARERTEELVRMSRTVLESRGTIGGQMGAGPHPGYLSSLYMTGVTMLSMLDVAEAVIEKDGDCACTDGLLAALRQLHVQFIRDDREMFPSSYGHPMKKEGPKYSAMWVIMALRIYSQTARLQGDEDDVTREGLDRALETSTPPLEKWAVSGRHVMYYLNPIYADAMLLGARLAGEGVEIAPLGEPDTWPQERTVETPYGDLTVRLSDEAGAAVLSFEAERPFPVVVRYNGTVMETSSTGRCALLAGSPS